MIDQPFTTIDYSFHAWIAMFVNGFPDLGDSPGPPVSADTWTGRMGRYPGPLFSAKVAACCVSFPRLSSWTEPASFLPVSCIIG